ncbi:MAG: RNA pseudouridine synthase [Clostridiales bacterium]|nr:RNA pseudouridine synthase [Clostridiales bacterium]
MKLEILHEDNHIIVVNKPPGILSQGDQTGDEDMLTLLRTYIKEKYDKPGNVFIGLVHRLDRPVGGLMVFARTSKAAARLSKQIVDLKLKKEYACVCNGTPPEGKWTHYLEKNKRTNISRVVRDGARGSKRASLQCDVLDTKGNESICRVHLYTGRSHQIRVQFQAQACPLLGDVKYNPDAKPGTWIALFSKRLTFWHPTKNDKMIFELDLPDRFPWKKFKYNIEF